MITIINYGLGNISAFANVYKRLNIPFKIATKDGDLKNAKKIILPGVGAFDHAMEMLHKSGMKKALDQLVLHDKVPILGICVGMQILGNSSEEGLLPGLGWIDGEVNKIDASLITQRTRLPHMGWNNISPVKSNNLLVNIDNTARFYFLHSFYFKCHNIENEIAQTHYGLTFSSVVNSENIYGVQFHPEKSHEFGVKVLRNFAIL